MFADGASILGGLRLLSGCALMVAGAVSAAPPEMIKDLGPAAGEWQLDYSGQLGEVSHGREGRQHSGQSFYGLSGALAVGGETMLGFRSRSNSRNSRLFFDYDSAVAIVRFGD